MKKLGIVIPTYNEEKIIDRTQEMISRFSDLCDIVFSDGYSTDKTYEKINFKKIKRSRYRSNQMNEGAKELKNDIILFLHADSKISREEVLELIEEDSDFGCFRLKFEPTLLFLKTIEWGSNFRVKYRHIAFGDQGIFIKRELFEKIGGFKPLSLMEDYELSLTLKEMGIYPKLLESEITTSSRRFIKGGPLKTLFKMQKYQEMYRKARTGGDIYACAEKIEELYRS